jgi:uncharacterized protein YidB (DUF937 family)
MSLLDELVSKVSSAVGANTQHAGLVGHVLDYLNSPSVGGVQGLVQAFERQGLGPVIASWVSKGANQSITPDQIRSVLGSAQVQQLAARVGISPDAVAAGLSKVLPLVVDHLTPGGQVPPAAPAAK